MNHISLLRAELRTRAEAWAAGADRIAYRSLGAQPTILFKPSSNARTHGNFHDRSWEAIQQVPTWTSRLTKPHSQRKALPQVERAGARELDSSNSSDALLMNCFCFRGAADAIVKGLELDPGPDPGLLEFGFSPMLTLSGGVGDTTEIDVRYGALLFEAKLTEADFTSRPKARIRRYAMLAEVFDQDLLPGDAESFWSYQVIRNILAAHQLDAQSVVLVDARRPDLIEAWRAVATAITIDSLVSRCHLRTWQDVARVVPIELAEFLGDKYGIAAGRIPLKGGVDPVP